MKNFWKELPRPVFSLAPMEDVTDTAFRQLVMEISDPRFLHVVFTEFTSTDGLCHPVGRDSVIQRLHINESELKVLKEKNIRIVAQIWGATPEYFYRAARMISQEMPFDGIDINMGCPVKKIVKQGGCSALIAFPSLAAEIIQATKEGAGLPVSVKTRTGIKKHDTERWIGFLLEQDPAAITLHARTVKDLSLVPADWNEVARAVQLRNQMQKDIPIIGNGDVQSVADALEKCRLTGADGVMVGRGIFHNPWIFNDPQPQVSVEERLQLLWHHVELFTRTWENRRNFAILKRFFKIYTSNFRGAARLRAALMDTRDASEVRRILDDFLHRYASGDVSEESEEEPRLYHHEGQPG